MKIACLAIQQGRARQKAENAMRTITERLKRAYPVAETLMDSWIKSAKDQIPGI